MAGTETQPDTQPSLAGTSLWLWWVVANTVSEIVGLGASALIAAVLALGQGIAVQPGGLTLPVAVLALAGVEGALVGYAQWLVLRRGLPSLPVGAWVLATVAGAVAAWLIGVLLSSDAAPPAEETVAFLASGAAVLGAGLGALIGLSQWCVLRRFLCRAGWWVLANALAWAAGMTVAFYGADPAGGDEGLLRTAARDAGTGILAGLLVGAVQGAFLVRLLRRPRTA